MEKNCTFFYAGCVDIKDFPTLKSVFRDSSIYRFWFCSVWNFCELLCAHSVYDGENNNFKRE